MIKLVAAAALAVVALCATSVAKAPPVEEHSQAPPVALTSCGAFEHQDRVGVPELPIRKLPTLTVGTFPYTDNSLVYVTSSGERIVASAGQLAGSVTVSTTADYSQVGFYSESEVGHALKNVCNKA